MLWFLLGGFFGLFIASIIVMAKDDDDRENDIYEDIYSSKNHEDKE